MQGATSIQRKEAVPATRKFPEKKKVLARRVLAQGTGRLLGEGLVGKEAQV